MTDRATLSKPAAMLPSAFQRPLVGSFGSRGQDQFADHAEDRESGVPGPFAADAGSQALAARAFTRGAAIHFRRGHFQPHTRAGRWLLTHELTHAIRSRTNMLARKGVGTPMGAAPNLRPSTPAEDREFVGLAIEFIQRGKEHYEPAFAGLAGTPRAPMFRTPPVSREQLVRQLEGWKAATTQCVTLIGTTLNNDATLDQQIRRAYRDAVEYQSWLEYFAESYAMFISAPEDLALLRPHVFAFMQANFP